MYANRKAFTLIELMFVIVIIGVLASVAIPKFENLRYQARITPLVESYFSAKHNAESAYLNLTELSGMDRKDVTVDMLFKVHPLKPYHSNQSYSEVWTIHKITKSSTYRYYFKERYYIRYVFHAQLSNGKPAGSLVITIQLGDSDKGDPYKFDRRMIRKRLGIDWATGRTYTETIDLN